MEDPQTVIRRPDVFHQVANEELGRSQDLGTQELVTSKDMTALNALLWLIAGTFIFAAPALVIIAWRLAL